MTSLYDRGMSMRREVLGDEHVDRSMGNVSEFARPVQDFVTEFVWGGVWNRDGLDLPTRSLLNLVTGVQTCALPISPRSSARRQRRAEAARDPPPR